MKDQVRGRWRTRDWVAAVLLFAATAAVVLWQNARLTVLWDLSYVLDSSWRMALGQMPYRDFPFVHAPLTFSIQAAIMRATGRVFFHHVLYVAAAGGAGTVVTWRVVLRVLGGSWGTALLLAAPATVLGVYGIFPHPNYDCDAILWVLVAILLLQRARGWASGGLAGVAMVLPLFFKQNIGLPFLLAGVGCMAVLLLRPAERKVAVAVLAGAAGALAVALLLLHATVGLANYWHWTVTFPAQRRIPSLREMVSVYTDRTLLWMLPCVAAGAALVRRERWRWLGFGLLAAPLLWPLVGLALSDDSEDRAGNLLALWPLVLVLAAGMVVWRLFQGKRTYRLIALSDLAHSSIVPVLALAAIHGTLLSKQLWGSTYAIWPLLLVLLAGLLAALPRERLALAGLAGVSLLVCGGLYVASEDRLSYAQMDGPSMRSSRPELAGMRARGPFLPDFDELLAFVDAEIPPDDGILAICGEDPFYFATGRVPRFPVLLFDPTTDPLTPEQVVAEVRSRNIRWLIVKRRLQIRADQTPDKEETLRLLAGEFVLVRSLSGYEVFRRK